MTFAVGDFVYQTTNRTFFNPAIDINPSTGFISIAGANSIYTIGDNVIYDVVFGHTPISGMIHEDTYHVLFANTTGIILSYPYRRTEYLNTSIEPSFANNAINESGHSLYIYATGTVYESNAGYIKVTDVFNKFGLTGTSNSTINSIEETNIAINVLSLDFSYINNNQYISVIF
jgi:hypothetical protein